jgi:hypothetical protein
MTQFVSLLYPLYNLSTMLEEGGGQITEHLTASEEC